MLLPISWLKQFVNIKASPQEIAEKLTLSGSEVEKIIERDKGLSKIVVGKINEINPHPDADKLQVVKVNVGNKMDLKIVCGAFNIQLGQKVSVVLAGGSALGLKVGKREIRGVKSEGMLASEKELGIGDNHSGIFILPETAKVGADVIKYLELDDPILDLDITPNRPDCLSIRGLAREAAALFGLRLTTYDLRLKESGRLASEAIEIEVRDPMLCPKFSIRVIQGVQVKPSPLWLQNKLRQVGIRSINNIVDVTNYVMMAIGKPLHAFDGRKVNGRKIIVRRARAGESILALDEVTYKLDNSMLVIADDKRAISIAGVMGGLKTAVDERTENVIIESAIFEPNSIRATSKKLNLVSESSTRFAKGIDWQTIDEALDLAAGLMQELGGGEILKGKVSRQSKPPQSKIINLPVAEVERLLGVAVKTEQTKSILKNLGFSVSGVQPSLTVKVPSWRAHDARQAADLVEEIGRTLDYNNLPKTLPAFNSPPPESSASRLTRRRLRQVALSGGYSEILTYSFYNESLAKLSGNKISDHIKLINPVNDEYPYLRASLGPWMFDKLSQNSSILPQDEFRLFEIGRVFGQGTEQWQAAFGLIDAKASDEELYRQLRGMLEAILGRDVKVEKDDKNQYACQSGKKEAGWIIIKNKDEVGSLRLRSAAAVMLVDLEKLADLKTEERKTYKPIPYYPQIVRDLAILVPAKVSYGELESYIAKANSLIKKVELFDVYHGLQKGESLAVRLTFYSTDRTLESVEVDEVIARLENKLGEKYSVTFR